MSAICQPLGFMLSFRGNFNRGHPKNENPLQVITEYEQYAFGKQFGINKRNADLIIKKVDELVVKDQNDYYQGIVFGQGAFNPGRLLAGKNKKPVGKIIEK